MERVIKFRGRTGRFDVSSFVWTNTEPLRLRFELNESRIGRYYVSIRHGERVITDFLDDNMSIELSPEWLEKGGDAPLEIIMEFRRKNGGEIIVPSADRDVKNGGYIIEPLQIERIDKQFTAVGYISLIEDMLASVNKRLDDVNARFARFEEVGVPLRFVGGEEETETEINNEEITENEEL